MLAILIHLALGAVTREDECHGACLLQQAAFLTKQPLAPPAPVRTDPSEEPGTVDGPDPGTAAEAEAAGPEDDEAEDAETEDDEAEDAETEDAESSETEDDEAEDAETEDAQAEDVGLEEAEADEAAPDRIQAAVADKGMADAPALQPNELPIAEGESNTPASDFQEDADGQEDWDDEGVQDVQAEERVEAEPDRALEEQQLSVEKQLADVLAVELGMKDLSSDRDVVSVKAQTQLLEEALKEQQEQMAAMAAERATGAVALEDLEEEVRTQATRLRTQEEMIAVLQALVETKLNVTAPEAPKGNHTEHMDEEDKELFDRAQRVIEGLPVKAASFAVALAAVVFG